MRKKGILRVVSISILIVLWTHFVLEGLVLISDLKKVESAGRSGVEFFVAFLHSNPLLGPWLLKGCFLGAGSVFVLWKLLEIGQQRVDWIWFLIKSKLKWLQKVEFSLPKVTLSFYRETQIGKKPKINLKKNRTKRAQSPLDQFSIVPFYPLPIGNLYFSFTNASFFLLLTLIFVLFSFHFVPNLVNEQIGGLSGNVKQQFFPCISVTFTFSLFRNLQGMIPYSFTVTSHFIVTLGLSFSLFIGITIVGFSKNGLHFLSFSLPAGVPLPLAPFLVLLELIPHCFRALSLGIRLFANMMAGHSLVKILSGFAWTMLCMNDLFYFIGSTGPFFIVLALTGLELGVAILQAYVFTILICIYLNDAINLH